MALSLTIRGLSQFAGSHRVHRDAPAIHRSDHRSEGLRASVPANPRGIMHQEDRRQRRSVDPLIALHYQLARVRSSGALDAIVVADASGVVVAGAGSWAVCEELAAYAPLLRHSESGTSDASRVAVLRGQTAVTSFEVDDQEVLVCARGGAERAKTLEEAAFGVARILKAA
jgi:hypothetical protein